MTWFQITGDGDRVIAEAEGLEAARQAAIVLLAEEHDHELHLLPAGKRFPLESVSLKANGEPTWRGSTLSRHYENETEVIA